MSLYRVQLVNFKLKRINDVAKNVNGKDGELSGNFLIGLRDAEVKIDLFGDSITGVASTNIHKASITRANLKHTDFALYVDSVYGADIDKMIYEIKKQNTRYAIIPVSTFTGQLSHEISMKDKYFKPQMDFAQTRCISSETLVGF
jgi:hypothetical protein